MAKDNSAMTCPVCSERVAADMVEPHLRRRHQIFQFRGERRSLNDTLSHLLSLVLRSPPDHEAWQVLLTIVREQHGPRADSILAASLLATLARIDPGKREAVQANAVNAIGGSDAVGLVATLVADPDPLAKPLALSIAARWPGPLPPAMLPPLLPLLANRKLPNAMLLPIAASLLSGFPGDSDPREGPILEALVVGLGRVSAVQQLYQLEELAGARPVLRSFRDRLEGQVRMRCPRCNLELRRAEMTDHLWSEHRLVLDGQKVREPWALLAVWLEEADGVVSRDLRTRCQSLATQADPENGPVRLQRLILQHCHEDAEAMKVLLAAAKERQASICPGCHALIPVPKPAPGHPLNSWRGRLSARGYRVELSDAGLRMRLELETPDGVRMACGEPGQRLSPRGRQWLCAGPFVFLALLLAVGIVPSPIDPLIPVTVALLAATGIMILVTAKGKPTAAIPDRAVDHAWSLMLPVLAERGSRPGDADFLAGLALASANRGRPEVRRTGLEKALKLVAGEAVKGRAVGPLAALRRLAVHDAVLEGRDPIPLVVQELAYCLEGRLPLAYGEALLTDWESNWWTTANLARLKVILCERAFMVGFEVSDLVEIGQSYSALGAVLGVAQPNGLICLRLLWWMRAKRPWDQAAAAMTAFELAPHRSSTDVFEVFPDLLLVHENPEYQASHAARRSSAVPLRIAVTIRGIALQDVLFEKVPKAFDSSGRKMSGQYELRVGSETFRFSADPTYVADRLERFFRFLFSEFLPKTALVMSWMSPDVGAQLRARGATPCPDCRQPLLPRIGVVAHTPGE